MFVYNTIKGELCLVECWMDEDYSERYEDGERDLIWIDRHHTNEFGDIENYMSQKFADISDTIWIEVHALRSTEVTRYEQKDEYYEMGDDCLGGDSYVWENNKLRKRCEEYV